VVSPHAPRRQRRALYEATSAERRKRMTVPLSRELRARFHRRSAPVRKGDTVRVLAGSYEGREERVARIDRRAYTVTLDNVTLKTAEEKLKELPLKPAYLVLTRLNLADPWRRRSLHLREEELTAEERGESTEAAETTAADESGAPAGAATDGVPPKAAAAAPPAPEPAPAAEPTRPKRRPRAPAAKPADGDAKGEEEGT
jgi:large subunit ribosomal protein L24